MSRTAGEIIEFCDRILESVEELPERAAEFAESVTEKVGSIKSFALAHDRVSSAQENALENMNEGVQRWINGRSA